MQSRVIQCMHKITGRHGNECFSSEKPAAYRPCHLQPCNEKINVNTITSPRLGKQIQKKGVILTDIEMIMASSVLCITLKLSYQSLLISLLLTKLDLFNHIVQMKTVFVPELSLQSQAVEMRMPYHSRSA